VKAPVLPPPAHDCDGMGIGLRGRNIRPPRICTRHPTAQVPPCRVRICTCCQPSTGQSEKSGTAAARRSLVPSAFVFGRWRAAGCAALSAGLRCGVQRGDRRQPGWLRGWLRNPAGVCGDRPRRRPRTPTRVHVGPRGTFPKMAFCQDGFSTGLKCTANQSIKALLP